MANEIQGKPEELGHGELDVEVIARTVVEHIARALDKAGELTDDETQASPEKLAPGEPDVEVIARAVVEHISRALDMTHEPNNHEAQVSPEGFAPGEPDVEIIARAVLEHIARALDKASEPTKDEAQVGPEQIGPRDPDVTSIDENTDGENVAFRQPLFDTHIIVDWSARGKPGPVKPTKDGIWWAVACVDDACLSVRKPEYARTRDDALRRLICLIADELRKNRRVLVGFDFPFGYPKGVAEHLTGKASALALWDWLAGRIKDEPDNANNRYDVAVAINEAYDSGLGPCWGRPRAWSFPTIPERKSARTLQGPHPQERRIADQRADGAKTVWQLAYAGSVGSQVLLGLPALKRLINDPNIARRATVWPLQTGLQVPKAQAVIAEIYPSLLRKEIEKRKHKDEIQDCAQVRINAEAFARLDVAGKLAPLFRAAQQLTPDQRHIIETEEAWILGLGHEQALRRALPSP